MDLSFSSWPCLGLTLSWFRTGSVFPSKLTRSLEADITTQNTEANGLDIGKGVVTEFSQHIVVQIELLDDWHLGLLLWIGVVYISSGLELQLNRLKAKLVQ